MQKDGDDLLPQILRYKTIMPNKKTPEKATPTANPIAVGLVPARTDGEASQADRLTETIIAMVTEELNQAFAYVLTHVKPAAQYDAGGLLYAATASTLHSGQPHKARAIPSCNATPSETVKSSSLVKIAR